jgi:sec-independent protein translocase protein TatC
MGAEEMSFWDHLEELRWTLVRSVVALFVFAIAGFILMPWLFDNFVLAPTKPDFFLYTFMCKVTSGVPFLPDFCDSTIEIGIQNIKLGSQFFTHMSTSFWLALVLTFPYLMFEVWRFVSPALFENEKKNVRLAFLFGTCMFFLGCAVGYSMVFPMTLRFLYTYELSSMIENHLALDSYISNFLMLVFVMGVVFQLPLLSWLLSKMGLLKKSFFKKFRKHAIVILLIAAAIITPSSDPFTLAIVFVPLYALYEFSILLVKADDPEEMEESSSEIAET